MEHLSFLEALHSKYKSDPGEDSVCVIFVPKGAPGTKESGDLVIPRELALDGCEISSAGNEGEIAALCRNVQLLDLSNNRLSRWCEVIKILQQLPLVSTVNISNNPLSLDSDWSAVESYTFPEVTKLALNSTQLTWPCLDTILHCFPSVEELYLCLNQLKFVDLNGVYPSVKRLHLNNNKISDWLDICKLGEAFPNMEYLLLMENPIQKLAEVDVMAKSSEHLQYLNLGQCQLNSWEEIDKIRNFPVLTDLRVQGIPLTKKEKDMPQKERRQQLIARLPNVTKLNGSPVHDNEREDAERAFIRLFMDKEVKPSRFHELDKKYGKLDPLVELNFEPTIHANIDVYCEGKIHQIVVNLTHTFADVRKQLKDIVNIEPSNMKIYFNDKLLPNGLELINPNSKRQLHSFQVKDGDEFHIHKKRYAASGKTGKNEATWKSRALSCD